MQLTEKELKVIELRKKEMTQVEIARSLKISQAAVPSFETTSEDYLIKSYRSSKSFTECNTIDLPLSSSWLENCFSSFNNASFCASKSPGVILSNKIPKCLDSLNRLSKKSASRVRSILPSFNAISKILPFLNHFGDNFGSCLSFLKNGAIPRCIFSSNKNFILCRNQFKSPFSNMCSEIKSSLYMFFSQRGVCFMNIFDSCPRFKHFQYQVDHYPGAFESWLPMADFTIGYNVFVNFDPHNKNNNISLFKYCDKKGYAG